MMARKTAPAAGFLMFLALFSCFLGGRYVSVLYPLIASIFMITFSLLHKQAGFFKENSGNSWNLPEFFRAHLCEELSSLSG